MRFAPVLFAALVVVGAGSRCGGVVDVDSDAGAACPVSNPQGTACSVEYAKCTPPAALCDASTPTTTPCTCIGGAWNCPDEAACPSSASCPWYVADGISCSVPSLECPSSVVPSCADAAPICTCQSATFHCPFVECAPCPSGSTIVPGGACGSPSQSCPWSPSDCDGGMLGGSYSCTCSGGAWSCEPGAPRCDAGAN